MASLSGKADAALVKAATDAAMAGVPLDISRVHERISKAHWAVAKSWGKVIGQIGKMGDDLFDKEKEDNTKPKIKHTNTNVPKK